jgi:DNA-directed RNA polymerase specialized sigma24 family protein
MPRTAPRSHVAAALPALHEALALWPADDAAGLADATRLRDRLRAVAVAALDDLPLREAAEELGVSPSTLQRWQASGVL